ncbi:MAG: Rdx family protein [Gammaproteobacteria bacterium]
MASSLAARISEELGVEPTLEKGVAGVFDVIANGQIVFSKARERRFPDDDEVIEALKRLGS